MSPRHRGAAARWLFVLAGSLCLAGPSAWAKPPVLTGFFPPGVARGQTATVTASGSFDHWPVRSWVDGPGLEIVTGPEKGKLTIRVAEDAEPGPRWVRLHDEEGATNLRPIFVGTLPEIEEVEPNDDPRRPQAVSPPMATLNGRLARSGDVDGFSVTLRKGQTLVADLEANRHLGAPMDAVLQVVSAGGFVRAQNDDTVGRDPRIEFVAPTDGDFLVRVFAFPATPDSSIRFAGGDAFVYRLTLTTGGFLDHAFPLAVFEDGRGTLEAVGPNLGGSARRLTIALGADDRELVRVFHPLLAGTAEIRRVAEQVVNEDEPNDLAHPQTIPNRAAVSGRIDPQGDRDVYDVVLRKGEKRRIRVESRAFGLPLDPVLRVLNADAKVLAEADDVGDQRDAELTFTAPLDGAYRVVVRDLNGGGGPRFAYLLQVQADAPDYALTLATDQFDLTPGKPLRLAVGVARRAGFAAPIEVVAEDLPEGVSARPALSRTGDASSSAVAIEVVTRPNARSGAFRLVGKAGAGSARPHVARAAITGFEARTEHPWLTIRPSTGSRAAGK